MKIKPILSWSKAAVAIAGTAFCAAAGAQSLSLSYNLDPRSAPSSEKAHPVVDRCSGLTWAASLAAKCGAQAFAPSPAPAAVAEAAKAREVPDTAAAQPEVDEKPSTDAFPEPSLPTLGSASADSRLLREASGKAPAESGKDVDLTFRFASKYRLRNGEEGWDVTRFKDVTSENRTQSSGVKALAVELMFPFQ